MKCHQLLAYLVVLFVIAGCAQRKLPPPYEQEAEDTSGVEKVPQTIDQPGPVDVYERPDVQLDEPPDQDSMDVDASSLGPKASPFSAGFVNDRINFYNNQLESLKTLDARSDITALDPQQTRDLFDCSRDLQRLLDGYQGLHEKLFRGAAVAGDPPDYENMIALQRLDIAYLGGSCATMLGRGDSAEIDSGQEGKDSRLQQVENELDEFFRAGAYEDVVQVWSQLQPYQYDRVDMKTAVQYADALMFLDQPAKSAETYQQIVDRVTASSDREIEPLVMRKRLADLYMAAGNFFDAEKQYGLLMKEYEQVGSIEVWARLQLSLLEQSVKGSPELANFTELLRSYLGYVPDKDGFSVVWKAEEFFQQYPYSPVSDNVDMIKTDALKQADQWFAFLMTEADQLVAEKQYQPAIDLLQAVPADKLSPENVRMLTEKLDNLFLAEAVDRETVKIEKMQELQRIWNEGSALAEAGDYDQAIHVLGQLTGTEYEDKALEKSAELALTASRIERRKAADLFVRSTKTDDVNEKKELLTESRKVLKDILAKYPDVEVADKVRGNISQVEKKMNDIDPMLLPEIEQQERSQEMLRAPVDDDPKIEGFDVDTEPGQSLDQPKKAILPVYTPQRIQ